MAKRIYLFSFIISVIVFAQDENRIGTSSGTMILAFSNQLTGIETFNGLGFSNIVTSSISSITSGNPACITDFFTKQIGITFDYTSPHEIFSSISSERTRQYLPTSIGFIYPMKYVHIGFGYYKKYSNHFDFGEIPLTTIQNIDGSSGMTFHPEFKSELHAFAVLTGYQLANLFKNNDKLSLGFQINLDYFYVYEEIHRIIAKINDYGFSGKLGFYYNPITSISLGILYNKGSYIKSEMKYEGTGLQENLSNDSSLIYYPVESSNQSYIFEMPDKFAYGFSYSPLNRICFSLTLSHIFWKRIDSSFENSIDLSSNVIFKFPDMGVDMTCGIYDKKENSDIFDFECDLYYLNFGIRKYLNKSVISIDISDSYNDNWDRLEQYILSLNVDYIFD